MSSKYYQRSKMAAHPTMKRVFEFSTNVQKELIRSTSDDSWPDRSVFYIIPRKAFVLHHYLMKEKIHLVLSLVFDCMLGCGSGSITFGTYLQLEPFGPIILIPVMAIVAYILGLIRYFYDGICSKLFQALLMIACLPYYLTYMVPPVTYDSSAVFCREKCVQCHRQFSQPLMSSTRICICVCESCPRRSDACTKCQSSPCTGTYSRVHISSVKVFSKILKKPSMVKK